MEACATVKNLLSEVNVSNAYFNIDLLALSIKSLSQQTIQSSLYNDTK